LPIADFVRAALTQPLCFFFMSEMKLRNRTAIIVLGFLLFGVFSYACGAIAPPQGFDGAQALSTSTIVQEGDLEFIGTVKKIYPLTSIRSRKNWAVVTHVDRVVSGDFSGMTFSFAIHSPTLSRLQVGRTYTIKATGTDKGYVVDELQWVKTNGSQTRTSKKR
jgi:hypothetical protein